MNGRVLDRLLCVTSLVIIATAGVAFAQDHPGSPGDEGYDWGRDNCGPHTAGLRSKEQCYACCSNEYDAQLHSPTWLNQCLGYCDSVNWDAWGGE